MKIITEEISKPTKGQGDLLDITSDIVSILKRSQLMDGNVTIFVVGSTAAITTIEYEPGLVKDMKDVWEQIAPRHKDWEHHKTWGDDNGSSHVRATIQGPSLVIPFVEGGLTLGTWQQVVLAEFDVGPRDRRIFVQLIGS